VKNWNYCGVDHSY